MESFRSSLSAGVIVRAILLEDAAVAEKVTKIYPIVAESAELPYIVYRRSALEATPSKAGQPVSDRIEMELMCCTADYGEGVELAEAVRNALDHITATHDGQRMRSCTLIGAEEDYQEDAFIQKLIFDIKI